MRRMLALILGAMVVGVALVGVRALWAPATEFASRDFELATTDPEPASQAPEPTLRADIQPIFNVACVRCHLHGRAIGTLDLAPGAAYASLLVEPSVQSPLPRVAPGQPQRSYLLAKLTGAHRAVGGSGMPMPMDGAALSPEQIERVRRWIAAGAPP